MSRMRSTIFVPASKPALAVKAASFLADVVCLDLEDGVSLDEKPEARKNLSQMAATLNAAGKPCWVRINSELELLADDIRFLPSNVEAVMLPKARDLTHIDLVAGALARLGHEHIKLIALIEDLSGIRGFSAVTSAPNSSLIALALGTEDLAARLGVATDSPMVEYLLMELLCVAKQLGLFCIGYAGSIAEFRDIEAFSRPLAAAAASGAVGGLCVHPAQIEALNNAFSISTRQLAWASRVIAAFDSANTGIVVVDGKMVDRPIYEQAKVILSRAQVA